MANVGSGCGVESGVRCSMLYVIHHTTTLYHLPTTLIYNIFLSLFFLKAKIEEPGTPEKLRCSGKIILKKKNEKVFPEKVILSKTKNLNQEQQLQPISSSSTTPSTLTLYIHHAHRHSSWHPTEHSCQSRLSRTGWKSGNGVNFKGQQQQHKCRWHTGRRPISSICLCHLFKSFPSTGASNKTHENTHWGEAI